MIRAEVPITVPEGDDPLLRILVSVVDSSGVKTPYDFTNGTIEFLIKKGTATLDDDADVVYEADVFGEPEGGRVDVQVLAADIPEEAGNRRYKLIVTKNDKRETVMAGQFIIQNL